MEKNKKIEEYTINELKVMAYDSLTLIEQTNHNLKIINARIAELSKLYRTKKE